MFSFVLILHLIQVDILIDKCDKMGNIRGHIHEFKDKLEGIKEDYEIMVSCLTINGREVGQTSINPCLWKLWGTGYIHVRSRFTSQMGHL